MLSITSLRDNASIFQPPMLMTPADLDVLPRIRHIALDRLTIGLTLHLVFVENALADQPVTIKDPHGAVAAIGCTCGSSCAAFSENAGLLSVMSSSGCVAALALWSAAW